MPPVQAWRPGKHHTAYVLKYAWGAWWGRGGTNGRPLNPEIVVPELEDEDLSAFETVAELGHYLDVCGVMYHGIGHIQNCDIRDPYCNNYSVRFFGWHKWIQSLFARLEELGKPLFDESKPLDAPLDCAKFAPIPTPLPFLSGIWTFQSFSHETGLTQDPLWPTGEMEFSLSETGGILGELRAESPEYRYEIRGYIDESNIYYETTPEWWDDRLIIMLRATGATPQTQGHVYDYRGTYEPQWPHGKGQIPTFIGSVICSHRPDDPETEGLVGSFFALQKVAQQAGRAPRTEQNIQGTQTHVFVESEVFLVPPNVSKVFVKVWGGGGGGGSDGPGVGGDDGKLGGTSRFGNFCAASGGHGGQHGVYQYGGGGDGGRGIDGEVNLEGEPGEKGGTKEGLTGKGGAGAGSQGTGGSRVGQRSNGMPGAEPGGGGSGAQERGHLLVVAVVVDMRRAHSPWFRGAG